MITAANLVGDVALTLNMGSLVGNGQYTLSNGWTLSESVDLTALMTPLGKQQVTALLNAIESQYQAMRQNTLSFAKYAMQDIAYLSALLGATVAADTTTSYVGTQSAKVVTPGAAVGEGIQLSLGTVARGESVTVTVVVNAPTGASLQLELNDTANQSQTLTAVSPATTPPSYTVSNAPITATSSPLAGNGNWQALSVTLTAGTANAPSLVAKLTTAAKWAGNIWVGSVQVNA